MNLVMSIKKGYFTVSSLVRFLFTRCMCKTNSLAALVRLFYTTCEQKSNAPTNREITYKYTQRYNTIHRYTSLYTALHYAHYYTTLFTTILYTIQSYIAPLTSILYYYIQPREDKGDREGIPHTQTIPQVIRLETTDHKRDYTKSNQIARMCSAWMTPAQSHASFTN